jgi:hypothetical protein
MSYDGKCEHGVYTHPLPPWERCDMCKSKHDEKMDERRTQVVKAFSAYITSGAWDDLDKGVGLIYYSSFKSGR